MIDDLSAQELPTYFANIVTSLLNPDEMVMEFRRYLAPHKTMLKSGADPVTFIPPASPEQILQSEPVARVVLTFSAVRILKQYLDAALPQIENQRKSQQT